MTIRSVLDSFSTLRARSPKKQIRASIEIIEHLVRDKVDADKELELVIRRIIRGLGATSGSSRVGYFTVFSVLPEVLKSPIFSIENCFSAIEKELEAFSREERADVWKGQVLAYGSLIFSDKIFEASGQQIETIIGKLISIRKQKRYLNLSVHMVLVELIKKVDSKIFIDHVWNIVRDKVIFQDKIDRSLEFYHLLYIINKRFPETLNKKLLKSAIGTPTVINRITLKEIGQFMLKIDRQKLVDSPTYHDMLDSIICDTNLLKQFWSVTVISMENSNQSKIKLALKMFIYIIKRLKDKNQICDLLLDEFVLILITNLTEELEQHRLLAIESLMKIADEKDALNSDSLRTIVEKLGFYPGNFKFVFASGQKLINSLMKNFSEENVIYFGNMFLDVIKGKSSKVISETPGQSPVTRPWKESQKKKAYLALTRLLSHPIVENSSEWKVRVLKVVINEAFFKSTSLEALQRAAEQCFFTCLNHKFQSLDQQKLLFKKLIQHINKKLINHDVTVINRTNEFWSAWTDAVAAITKIGSWKTDNTNIQAKTTFEIMFLLLTILLIKDADFAIPLLKELHVTFNVMNEAYQNGESTKEDSEMLQEAEKLHWSEVVTEIFLSLLSNESRLTRNVLINTFPFMCPYLTEKNVFQLLKVLDPKENDILADIKDDIESDDDDKTETETDDSEDECDSDNPKLKSESLKKHATDDEMSGDEGEDLDNDKDEEKDLEVLRENVFRALNTVPSTDKNLDDMSEDEGRRLDDSLSEAFRLFKQSKKKNQAAEEIQLNILRSRVLDLLEIYIKSNPSLDSLLDIMVAVLTLSEHLVTTGTCIELQNRLRKFLNKLTSIKKFECKRKINSEEIVTMLKNIVDKGERTAAVYGNMKEQVIDCCTFILKLSLKNKKHYRKIRPQILDVYQEALKNFFTKKNCVIPLGLFTKAFSLPWNGAFTLVETVISVLTEKKDVSLYYRRCAVLLLNALFSNGRLWSLEMREANRDIISRIGEQLIHHNDVFQNVTQKNRKVYLRLIQMIKKQGFAPSVTESVTVKSLKKNMLEESQEDTKPDVTEEEDEIETDVKSEDDETDNLANGSGKSQGEKKIKKKLKRQKYGEAMKEKKLNKLRRLELASEGLEDGIFTTRISNNRAFIEGEIIKSDEEEMIQ